MPPKEAVLAVITDRDFQHDAVRLAAIALTWGTAAAVALSMGWWGVVLTWSLIG